MTDYYVYLYHGEDSKTKEPYLERRYYRKRIKETDELKYVGKASLSPDYFITGAQTKYTEISSLSDISVRYTATLANGNRTDFEHNVGELLYRAKEGLLTYINFEGFRVGNFIVKIHGKRTLKNQTLKYNVDMDVS